MTKPNHLSRGSTLSEQLLISKLTGQPNDQVISKAKLHKSCKVSMVQTTTTINEYVMDIEVKTCSYCGIDTFQLEQARKYNVENQTKSPEPIRRCDILPALEGVRNPEIWTQN